MNQVFYWNTPRVPKSNLNTNFFTTKRYGKLIKYFRAYFYLRTRSVELGTYATYLCYLGPLDYQNWQLGYRNNKYRQITFLQCAKLQFKSTLQKQILK